MNIETHLKLAGHFIIKKNGVQVAEFDNLITDYGLNLLGNSDSANWGTTSNLGTNYSFYAHPAIAYMHIGAGTATPANSDTALSSFRAGSNTPTPSAPMNSSMYTDRVEIFKSVRFGAGVGTGTITEIGMSTQATPGNLFCRALITDSLNNPVSIVKAAGDILDIEYRLTLRPTLTDVTGTLSGYSYTLRPLGLNQVLNNENTNWGLYTMASNNVTTKADRTTNAYHTASLAATSSNTPTGTLISAFSSFTNSAYVANSHRIEKTLTMLPTAGNHANGISGITFPLLFGYFQVVFGTPIMKTSTNTLNIRVSISWGR